MTDFTQFFLSETNPFEWKSGGRVVLPLLLISNLSNLYCFTDVVWVMVTNHALYAMPIYLYICKI